jgi:carotenoid cleavage dioxygenase-like enzyme
MPVVDTNRLNLVGHETSFENLEIKGEVPGWLSGTLLRNGPTHSDSTSGLRHWFDGLAMLHRFGFSQGRVNYTGKYLNSKAFKKTRQEGKIAYREFGADPCQTLFGAIKGLYSPEFSDNASVNIDVLAGRFLALSETPLPLEFDPATLEARPGFNFTDKLHPRIALTTAHPHYDFSRQVTLNYGTQIGSNCRYNLYYIEEGLQSRKLLASVPAGAPAYMHSFAHTPNFVILAEYPLLLDDPFQLGLGFKPFIENFKWQPEKGTRFLVINKARGRLEGVFEAESLFAFHHINAFEQQGELFLDLAAYPDPTVIEALYLDRLFPGGEVMQESAPTFPTASLKRFRLQPGRSTAQMDILSAEHLELPRINYRQFSTRPYRFVYAVSRQDGPNILFEDRLVKVDCATGERQLWQEANCYPGEPVFVAMPGGHREDEGVVLSVVVDLAHHNSFLLILDAASFTEKGRACVPTTIPLGLHGNFFESYV